MRSIWPFWLICLFLFVIIQFDTNLGLSMPKFTKIYVKDFLCMPIVLGICLICLQLLEKDRYFTIKFLPIFILTIWYSIYFEAILPQYMQRYTSDWWDVFLYFLGAIAFYFLQFNIKKAHRN